MIGIQCLEVLHLRGAAYIVHLRGKGGRISHRDCYIQIYYGYNSNYL